MTIKLNLNLILVSIKDICVSGVEPNFIYLNLMLYIEQQTMLNPYMRYISEENYIVGRRHLACRHELAEDEQSFPALCESTVWRRFAWLFRIALSVEWPSMWKTGCGPRVKKFAHPCFSLFERGTLPAALKALALALAAAAGGDTKHHQSRS